MTNNEEIEYDNDAFEAWWHNEGSQPMTKEEMHLYDREEFVQLRAKEAWLNGAYKARELQKKDEELTCDTCISYVNEICDDHKGHYCIYGDSMEDRHIKK